MSFSQLMIAVEKPPLALLLIKQDFPVGMDKMILGVCRTYGKLM